MNGGGGGFIYTVAMTFTFFREIAHIYLCIFVVSDAKQGETAESWSELFFFSLSLYDAKTTVPLNGRRLRF